MKSKKDKKDSYDEYKKILEKHHYPKTETLDIFEAIQNIRDLARVILNFEENKSKRLKQGL